jgi:hypothetical protein
LGRGEIILEVLFTQSIKIGLKREVSGTRKNNRRVNSIKVHYMHV